MMAWAAAEAADAWRTLLVPLGTITASLITALVAVRHFRHHDERVIKLVQILKDWPDGVPGREETEKRLTAAVEAEKKRRARRKSGRDVFEACLLIVVVVAIAAVGLRIELDPDTSWLVALLLLLPTSFATVSLPVMAWVWWDLGRSSEGHPQPRKPLAPRPAQQRKRPPQRP